MNKTKKLLILVLVLVMCLTCFMPSTFAWYVHNETTEADILQESRNIQQHTGANNSTYYTKGKGLPVSGSSGLIVSTVQTDKQGVGTTEVSAVNFASADTDIQYYKTTFNNENGSGDVYAELGVTNLKNDANVKLGITSPVLNEKGFDITRTPAAHDKTRVYFLTTSAYDPYWTNNDTSSSTYDMRLCYYVGATGPTEVRLTRQAIPNNLKSSYKDSKNVNSDYIYYCDLPNTVTTFFFCNHYYFDNPDNKDWNRTPDITDLTPGIVYKLNGKNIDDSYKLYDKMDINKDLVALNKYYSTVSLSRNGYVDISLKKQSDNSEQLNFTPDYYGKTITYAVKTDSPQSSSDRNYITVTSDGLVTAGANSTDNLGHDVIVRTTITGECGDTQVCDTKIIISDSIAQMPVAQNVLVEKGKTVVIYWYALRKHTNQTTANETIADSIYYTV